MIEETKQEEKQRWTIENDDALKWTLDKIRSLQLYQAANTKHVEEVQKRADKENEALQKDIDNFTQLVNEYTQPKFDADPEYRFKSTAGNVTFDKQRDKWNYNTAMLLKQLDGTKWVKVKENRSIDKTGIKNNFKVQDGKVFNPETGEVLKGINVVQGTKQMKIKF
ncbi:hypothetical protein HMPREF0501_00481 [Limosilactobacillus coleohominis 101-4-CHN]|uniref:Uncharacterized protein n=1 Tax=Limosilactobacillus coleohominis 101-4-CHN TaxID=575594 RepID=C7XUW5_9LACO|nr:host-nuclease inhibitor Gam family protein [Limosilactobacillus coleohominis]EEU31076.1 hypothetical protein HMPREF0501_00481 [Limosilactobacillus coleohominis 101-4-CHN]